MIASALLQLTVLATAAFAAPVQELKERAGCSAYTIIDTRGTGELQGPSAGFRTMNSQILSAIPGGKEYDTVYLADFSQNSAMGTTNIVNQVQNTLRSDPSHCFFLEGYSQGAAATVDALPKLTGANFDAVKGVFLIGNPRHKPNLACNVDASGGKTTAGASGLAVMLQTIPDNWVSKTKDVCLVGDGVCFTASGFGITPTHLTYPGNSQVQSMGVAFAKQVLQGS